MSACDNDSAPARKKPRTDDSALLKLQSWLRSNFEHDVLIPCAVGEKRPAFQYRDGWSWDKFDSFSETGKASDWAILLRELCVLDVDDFDVAHQLESEFNVLRTVPCETTQRGLHYFFRRSSTADHGGYYDGCSQVRHNVDFKTITPTGTGGVIVVSPSTDKAWRRAPWDAALVAIPDDLLIAVAKPSLSFGALEHAIYAADPPKPPSPTFSMLPFIDTRLSPDLLAATVRTEEEEEKVAVPEEAQESQDPNAPKDVEIAFMTSENDCTSRLRMSGARLALLRKFDFCAALLSGRWTTLDKEEANGVPTVQLHCSQAVLEELLSLHEHGTVTNDRPPSDDLLATVEQTADMLGAPPRCDTRGEPKNPLLERATFWADLWRVCPDWWTASTQEQARMLGRSPADSDASLVRIDHALAQTIGYEHTRKASSMWLFRELPSLLSERFSNYKVFCDEPEQTLEGLLPPPVLAILRRHASCVAVAGGAVLGGVSRFAEHGHDVDLFVYGLDKGESEEVLRQIEAQVETEFAGEYELSRSPAAVTYTLKKAPPPYLGDDHEERWKRKGQSCAFQIVLGIHRARSQIVEYFDLAPCKALARIDAASGGLVVEALPSFVEALRKMAFHVDDMYWSPASVARICKYVAKGFECAVPGVRRDAFKADPYGSDDPRYGTSYFTRGLAVLFQAEKDVLRSRKYWSQDVAELKKKGEMVFGGKLIIEPIDGRLEKLEAETIASKIANKLGSGYKKPTHEAPRRAPSHDEDGDYWGDDLYDFYGCNRNGAHTNTYGFIRESFRADVAVRLGDARRNIPIGTKFWTFTNAGRFKPSSAYLEELYDKEKLNMLAAKEAANRALAIASPDGFGDCAYCGEPCALVLCEPCGVTFYCNEEHAAADEARHKAECEDIQAECEEDDESEDTDEDDEGEEEEEEPAVVLDAVTVGD